MILVEVLDLVDAGQYIVDSPTPLLYAVAHLVGVREYGILWLNLVDSLLNAKTYREVEDILLGFLDTAQE